MGITSSPRRPISHNHFTKVAGICRPESKVCVPEMRPCQKPTVRATHVSNYQGPNEGIASLYWTMCRCVFSMIRNT